MFDNIGGKVKRLATVICWIGIIASVIFGIILIQDKYLSTVGIAILIGGSVASWVGSFVLYGFGELVENSAIIAESLKAKSTEQDKETTAEINIDELEKPKGVTTGYTSFDKCLICGKVYSINEMYSDGEGKYVCEPCYLRKQNSGNKGVSYDEIENCKACGQLRMINLMYRDPKGKYICKECYDKGIR